MSHRENQQEWENALQTGKWGQSFKNDGSEDYRIYQDIILGLYRSVINTDHLVISVNQGTVFLSGELETHQAREKILGFVAQIRGVNDVKCHVGLGH